MEETKKRKSKKLIVENKDCATTNDVSLSENSSSPISGSEKVKRVVHLITPSLVIFWEGETLSHTPNIWGDSLKPGDCIEI
jgi:hypothetical protein